MQIDLNPTATKPPTARSATASVRVYSQLTDLPPTYGVLFEEGEARTFFLSLPWFHNFCSNALNPGEKVRIFSVELEDAAKTPVAALITRHSPAAPSIFRPRTLSSLSNFYTSLYEPLCSPQCYSPLHLEAIAQAIRGDSPSWDVVDLKWLDPDAPIFMELQQAFRAAGMIVQTYFCAGNWYSPVSGVSFHEYLQSLRSSVRNIANSKNKKIERSGRARFEIVTGYSGLEPAVEAYGRIYAASWKVPEPYPRFVPGLIRACADRGWLRLGIAYVDGEPAAGQIWIVSHGTASIYKMAYDKRFSDFSIGSFLTTRMMEHALDVDKVREVDYLTGDDSYKRDWMSRRRERWGILALNPHTPRGALAIARHVGGRAVRRAVQSITKQVHGRRKTSEST